MYQKRFLVLFTTLFCVSMAWSQKPSATLPPKTPQFSTPPDVLGELREKWNLSLGMDMGISQLYHKVDFQRTPMYDFYNSIKAGPLPDYTWEEFEEDYDFKKTIIQPRFGFAALLTYGNVPAFLSGEFISSSSSYQKMTLSATLGLGKDIFFGFEENNYFSFKGGYKIMFQDNGFGAETLVNSVGNKKAKEYIERFFDPQNAIGSPRGDLMTMRLGLGKYIGKDRRTNMGIELYGELDLTNETLRIARMNTLGLNCYVNFILF